MRISSAIASASVIAVLALSGCGFGSSESPPPECPADATFDDTLDVCVMEAQPEPEPEPEPEPDAGSEPPTETEQPPETEPQPEAPPECPETQVFDELTGECVEADPDVPEPLALSTEAVCSVNGELEGAFTEAQILHYLDCVVPGVDGWLDTVYPAMTHPNAYVYVPVGAVGADECGEYDDQSAHYCTASDNIYLGHERVWGYYSVLGDASLFMVVAHEVMHHIQSQVGVYDHLASLSTDGRVTPASTVLAENQADCGAGAYLSYVYDSGYLTGEEDMNDLTATLSAIADSERDGRDHGRLDERMDAFKLGFTSELQVPLVACNDVIPEFPIIGE